MKNYNDLITNKNGQPLRILQIAKHCCVRVARIIEALKSIGYEVDGLVNKIAYNTELFDRMGFWHHEKQYKNHLKAFKGKYDILEIHNEPDVMVRWAREVLGDSVKIIHNAHDLDNVRRGLIPIEERFAFINADAAIFVSEPIKKICDELHSLDYPTMVLYNYPTQSMVDNTKIDWENVSRKRNTLVYEGGVNPIGDSQEIQQMNKIFKYRNLFPIFQQLIEQGNEVHVYAGNSDAYTTGQHTGVILHPPTKFDILLQEMTRFKYNLLIFNNEDKKQDQVNYTTPNKLWDGLAAGLPSLACWCNETEKYVVKHNLGWRFNNINDIGDCSSLDPEYMEKMKSIKKKREELIFERQICLTENLYAEVLGVEKKDIPLDIQKQLRFEYGDEAIDKSLTPTKLEK